MGGRLALGTWQGIYLFEHRIAPHRREVAHVMRSKARGGKSLTQENFSV